MAYGMKIEGVDGIYQIDGSTSSTSYLQITHNATGTSVSGFDAGDIVFARPTSGSGRFCSNFQVSPPTFNVQAEYLVLKPSNSSNLITETGLDYGLQIKNTAGVVIYDSRNCIGGVGDTNGTTMAGLEIDATHPKASLTGGVQTSAGETGNLIYQSSSANWDNTFVSVNSGTNANPNNIAVGYIIDGSYWDSTNYRVRFEGWLQTGFDLNNPTVQPNKSLIMAAIKKG